MSSWLHDQYCHAGVEFGSGDDDGGGIGDPICGVGVLLDCIGTGELITACPEASLCCSCFTTGSEV